MPHAPLEPSVHRSSLPGTLLIAYLAALAYGSLYPASGWHASGLPAFAFLFEPWPRYWTGFDVATNIAVYVAPAALAQALLLRRLPTVVSTLVVVVLASTVSLALEAAQAFLPARVPSRLDWLANTAGALLGALLAKLFASARAPRDWMVTRAMPRARAGATSATGLTLLAAWLALQLYPQRLLFGNGDIVEPILRLWSSLTASLVETTDPTVATLPAARAMELADSLRLHVDHSVLIEASGTAVAIVAIGLLVREIHSAQSPRTLITIVVLAAGAAIRSASGVWLLGAGHWLGWLTAGAQGGIVVGTVVLAMLASARRRVRLVACVAAIAATAALTSVFPHDPYHASALGRWDAGAWRNFTGLLEGASTLWPVLAIAWCTVRLSRRPSDAGSIMPSQR